jgi:hypothetical protein
LGFAAPSENDATLEADGYSAATTALHPAAMDQHQPALGFRTVSLRRPEVWLQKNLASSAAVKV